MFVGKEGVIFFNENLQGPYWHTFEWIGILRIGPEAIWKNDIFSCGPPNNAIRIQDAWWHQRYSFFFQFHPWVCCLWLFALRGYKTMLPSTIAKIRQSCRGTCGVIMEFSFISSQLGLPSWIPLNCYGILWQCNLSTLPWQRMGIALTEWFSPQWW